MVAFVFVAAILRFMRVSMSWSIDFAMLLLSWTAFLGADIAWRDGQMVGLDLLVVKLPPPLRKFIGTLFYLIILVLMITIMVYGFRLILREPLRLYNSMPIPYWWLQLSIIVMSISMMITTILKIRRNILNFGNQDESKKMIEEKAAENFDKEETP
jgi:TRAP-type C4-dicarboxylate transport system permease small subunit